MAFPIAHSALRKLPATVGAAREKDLAIVADQYDADVGAKAFCIDDIFHAIVESATNCGRSFTR